MGNIIERLTSWRTSLPGLLMAVFFFLVQFNVIGADQTDEAEKQVYTIYDGILSVLVGLSSLILLFTKEKKGAVLEADEDVIIQATQLFKQLYEEAEKTEQKRALINSKTQVQLE